MREADCAYANSRPGAPHGDIDPEHRWQGVELSASHEPGGWIYPIAGLPAMGAAIALERRLGYVPAAQPDPFVALGLQILFIPVLACPAVALVWDSSPEYVLVAFAAIVGAHFLPFEWLYRTGLYRFLGVVIAVGPYILAILFGERALHYTGFFVGSVMMRGAFGARSYAAATWRAHHALTASPDVVPATGRRIR